MGISCFSVVRFSIVLSPDVRFSNIYISSSIHSKPSILHQSINMAHSKNIQKGIQKIIP